MALEALSTNELLNFIIYDALSATPYTTLESSDITASASPAAVLFETSHPLDTLGGGTAGGGGCSPSGMTVHSAGGPKPNARKAGLGTAQGRKKRRRRPRVCKNKEEAETQRMTHIAVERNRRKQMNEHLAVLKSLMPESYVQRGDQASIVGGAIDFVKELEHLLQTLETQKLQQKLIEEESQSQSQTPDDTKFITPPFSQFFAYPQYTWSQLPNNTNNQNKFNTASSSSSSSSRSSGSMAAVADIEVTLIETHANLRILSRRRPRQLSRLVAGFHTLHLSILHLSVTTLHPLVLYSISAKVEEGCQLTTVDDIAGAVHHMLRIIEEGGGALC